MKNINYKYLVAAVVAIAVLYACSDDVAFREPTGSSNGTPDQVSEVTVTNYPGRATIRYEIPEDPDLLYVKAVYKITNGRTMEAKAS